MLKSKTLFIIGAGASKAYGFPLGKELYESIHNGDYIKLYTEFLQNTDCAKGEKIGYLNTANQLVNIVKSSKYSSIDSLITHIPIFKQQAKEAIALLLLKKEMESRSAFFQIADENDWIKYLVHTCKDNILKSCVIESDISFITFNYERSLEYFLSKALSKYTSYKTSHFINNNVSIRHVYGNIGRLEWQIATPVGELKYGWDYRNCLLSEIQNAIKLMGPERFVDNNEKDNYYQKEIIRAEKIYFLGFSYDKINLKKLGFDEALEDSKIKEKKIYGTAIGMDEDRIRELKKRWGENHEVELRNDLGCKQLLCEYLK